MSDNDIVLVGARVDGPLMMADNLTGPCAECGHQVQYRPHAPKFTRLICIECWPSVVEIGDTVGTTPQMLEDAKAYFRKKMQ